MVPEDEDQYQPWNCVEESPTRSDDEMNTRLETVSSQPGVEVEEVEARSLDSYDNDEIVQRRQISDDEINFEMRRLLDEQLQLKMKLGEARVDYEDWSSKI
jgi:hypothetical protein